MMGAMDARNMYSNLAVNHKERNMHGHDRHNTTILSIIRNMSTACFGQYYFWPSSGWIQLSEKTTQYVIWYSIIISVGVSRWGTRSSASSRRHPIDTSSNNGKHYEITDVTRQCIDLHIKPSAHTPSNSFVNEISSASTYTNTDRYTVSYYILCSFLR